MVTTEYNDDLTVKRIVDAKNQVYKFSYNALGWPTARFDLADTTKADSTWYDAAGRQPDRLTGLCGDRRRQQDRGVQGLDSDV